MKPNEIQDLIDFIARSGLDEVNIETEQFKLKVKKHSGFVQAPAVPAPTYQATSPVPVQPTLQSAVNQPAATPTDTTGSSSATGGSAVPVKSPMIGTFYRSSNPETPVFVNVGDEVKKGQTLCIIEAMKLFNEIEAETAGRIVKVLVENASPVEYEQPLFLIEPLA